MSVWLRLHSSIKRCQSLPHRVRRDASSINTSPISPGIYLISRASRTVYETSLAGTFISSYRAYDETLFEGLANVVVDDNRKVIYVLSGNTILAFPG